jgi:hypothetical protein
MRTEPLSDLCSVIKLLIAPPGSGLDSLSTRVRRRRCAAARISRNHYVFVSSFIPKQANQSARLPMPFDRLHPVSWSAVDTSSVFNPQLSHHWYHWTRFAFGCPTHHLPSPGCGSTGKVSCPAVPGALARQLISSCSIGFASLGNIITLIVTLQRSMMCTSPSLSHFRRSAHMYIRYGEGAVYHAPHVPHVIRRLLLGTVFHRCTPWYASGGRSP